MHGKAVGYVFLKDVIIYVHLNDIVEIISILRHDVAVSGVCSLTNSEQLVAVRFSGEHCTSGVCLQLSIFTELRLFSKP